MVAISSNSRNVLTFHKKQSMCNKIIDYQYLNYWQGKEIKSEFVMEFDILYVQSVNFFSFMSSITQLFLNSFWTLYIFILKYIKPLFPI